MMKKTQTRSKSNKRNEFVRVCMLRASSANDDNRSIEAVIATDEPIEMYDYEHGRISEILVIEGARYADQVPLLDSHARYSVMDVLGSTRDFRKESGSPSKLIARNYYASDSDSMKAWQKARDGHLTDNSIGYRLNKYTMIDPGQTATVGGRKYTAPKGQALRVVTDWEIFENSNCPIGADNKAKNRSKPEQNEPEHKEFKTMKLTPAQRAHIASKGIEEPDSIEETMQRALLADFDKTPVNPPTPGLNEAERAIRDGQIRTQAAEAEGNRRSAILALAVDSIPKDVVQRCIDDVSCTISMAREAFYSYVTKSADTINSPNIMVADRSATTERLEAGILLRGGYIDESVIVRAYGKETVGRADDNFRDNQLLDVCRMALIMDGKPVPNNTKEMVRAAQSTISLPTILGNVAHISARAGYESADDTWQQWVNEETVTDFKDHTMVSLSDIGDLEDLKKNGEFAEGTLAETAEKIRASTKGKMIYISRNDLMNDSLKLLTKVPTLLGIKAVLKIGDMVYAVLMGSPVMADGKVLFHADHNNLLATNPLGFAGIKASRLAMRKQKDKDGKPTRGVLKNIIVPPELELDGEQIISSSLLLLGKAGDTDDETTMGSKNVLASKGLKIITEDRLSCDTFTGSSESTWYGAAAKGKGGTISVGFLNGKKGPSIETYTNIPGYLGMAIQVYMDAGVAPADFRNINKNT